MPAINSETREAWQHIAAESFDFVAELTAKRAALYQTRDSAEG